MFACFVPAAEIHQGDTLRVMVFGGFRRGYWRTRNSLIANADMHFGAVVEFFRRTAQDALQRLLGALKFLLLKEFQSLFVSLQLSLLGGRVRIWWWRLKLRHGL